ncbi:MULTISPECIES: hypothetical protein [Sphingobacterium]|uniref:hypothetical protein n=1 Tax=Sphingobacterium TaxID=28453 RepID=UPI00162351B5|nr:MULTISPECIES: hypothetical protein [Sphingobacterium]MBV2228110.1 hypothetical protein [Sphingobacterium mizutaii]
MKNIGSILFIYGILAIIMNFFNAVPRILLWIYNWGEGTAWLIKIAFVLVGAAIWWFSGKDEVKDETPTDQPTQP